MILDVIVWLLGITLVPVLTLSTIRKVKARLQNRVGPPLLQPFMDLIKLSRKSETLSETFTWIFRSTAAINVAVMLLLASMVPWLSSKPTFSLFGISDLFLVFYLFAASRLFTVLAAMDSGSSFGAFGASREVTLAFLVEPAAVLSMASLGALSHSSNLNVIFSFSNSALAGSPIIWLLCGTAIFIASLVELSRAPVDDPTTHLELTMVHEAMILEASGRNLALIEYAHWLKMALLFGLVVQCYMRASAVIWNAGELCHAVVSVLGIFLLAAFVGVLESVVVKLQWAKVPEFIAYSLTMSFLATLLAISGGVLK